jgi:hypothetical protein
MSFVKKIGFSLISFILLMVIVGGVFYYYSLKNANAMVEEQNINVQKLEDLGKERKAIANNPNKDVPVIKIGNVSFSLERFLEKKSLHQFGNSNVTINQIADTLKNEVVLVQEAKNRNLYPSKEDVKNYIIQQRKMIEQSNDPESFEKYVAGMGMTLNGYWNTAEPQYEIELAMVNASKDVVKDILQEPTETPKDFYNRKNKAFKDFMARQKQKLQVEILREDLINNN